MGLEGPDSWLSMVLLATSRFLAPEVTSNIAAETHSPSNIMASQLPTESQENLGLVIGQAHPPDLSVQLARGNPGSSAPSSQGCPNSLLQLPLSPLNSASRTRVPGQPPPHPSKWRCGPLASSTESQCNGPQGALLPASLSQDIH